MERTLEPEWLDVLPATHRDALGSRKDLRRLNTWMGSARRFGKLLGERLPGVGPRRLLELGAGDGRLMSSIAKHLGGEWKGTVSWLLDRQPALAPAAVQGFKAAGWHCHTIQAEVFDWLAGQEAQFDAVMANLFLHHFTEHQLAELLRAVSQRTRVFIALEPRRSTWCWWCSRLVGCIGCNAVTRHDAPVSVRAGFTSNELSRVWPAGAGWILAERAAGLFSHLFIARTS